MVVPVVMLMVMVMLVVVLALCVPSTVTVMWVPVMPHFSACSRC